MRLGRLEAACGRRRVWIDAPAASSNGGLPMEARDEHGLAEHVAVHRVDDRRARRGGFRGVPCGTSSFVSSAYSSNV